MSPAKLQLSMVCIEILHQHFWPERSFPKNNKLILSIRPLFLLRKTRLLIDLNHCEYIFLRTSSAQDLNSSSLFTKHGHGKRGVLENKNKRACGSCVEHSSEGHCILRLVVK